MELVLFAAAAVAALAGGAGIIASRLPVHSALSLLLVLGSLAVLYLLLAAQFIAALQVIIYAGAIVVLFLFVIMLLHARSGEAPREKLRGQRAGAVVLAAGFLAVVVAALRISPAGAPAPLSEGFGTAQTVGRTLFTGYVLPFELASIVLLVGIIAAAIVGRPLGKRP